MAAAGARAQKPVGSAPWIAAEKENMADLVEQEMEEVEYPVRHEMAWLNEHMTEILSTGQTNFADVFKTPGKMRGKTPRTARKRAPEESRVPLSEIFSSAQKQLENHASPSPFIHRVVSKTAPVAASPVPRTKDATQQASQPEYPDLTANLNSFPKYNTDSGYHGMSDADEVVLPDVQSESQASTQPATQPLEQDEEMDMDTQDIDTSAVQQTNEESFHSAQEDVRSRGGTVEPNNKDPTPTPTPTQERTKAPTAASAKESSAELGSTPVKKTKSKPKMKTVEKQQKKEPESKDSPEPISRPETSPEKMPAPPVAAPVEVQKDRPEDEVMEDATEDPMKDDTVLDNLDDIGSPSDGSTPERLPVRKSSLSFASLPAREPLKSLGGSRLSRTSHIDISKMNNPRASHFGRQTGGHKMTQSAAEEDTSPGAMDIDHEKERSDEAEPEQATRTHSKKSTQTLHERISMLGKLQPVSRPRKSIPSSTGVPAGQVAYPDLAPSKPETKPEPSGHKTQETPVLEPTPADDDWIKPLSSPQRPEFSKSKTTGIMEKLSELEKERAAEKKDMPKTEPERPKSSASIFSSPRPHGHQQSASLSRIPADISTTPTGSPRRFDGHISASKLRLHSIMKSAKGLFSSTGNTPKLEPYSPEQPRPQTSAGVFNRKIDFEAQPVQPPSPTRQEGRRTRSSTEKEQKRRQHEREEQEREEQEEEARAEKAREQEKQKALQLKAAHNKSSVEPEERSGPVVSKNPQPQRQQSREPESSRETSSRFAIPQPKQTERRPLKPTRETLQKPTPQPMSIRVGSTLSRQIAMPASSVAQESSIPAAAPAPAPAPKPTLKKKGSNTSLHTSSSAGSFKSSISSQTQAAQRKAQVASKKEQEDRRKEEQRRELERKRAAQQEEARCQEEARRQGMRSRAESRAEADRERRERSAQEDPKRAAQMEAIRRRQQENARGHGRQGSQQIANEGPILQHEKPSQSSQRSDLGSSRPPSRLGGSMQPHARINPPAPTPAKPPKRVMNDDSSHRPAVSKPSNVQSTGDAKRRKTEDEHNPMQPVRTIMPGPPMPGQPMRQSYIRKPSISTFNHGQSSMAHQSGSSIFKNSAPQRPAHPGEMGKFATGKIPFAESNPAPPPAAQRAPNSAQRPAAKPSPKYPSGENVHLPEINTDSEDDDDSDSEMFPVPKWAQPKELEGLLRQQDGMEVDSIFGPIAPFSLEDTFKADKKIKKYRDRTSSANWSGPDGLTQEEIRKDVADRQRLRLNGGWSFNS